MDYTNVFGNDTVPPSGLKYRLIPLTKHVSVFWPDNYEGNDFLADINDVTASLQGWIITLPPANQQSTGRDCIMRNVGAYSFQVNNYKGVPVAVIKPGETKYLYITDNSTDAGVWGVFTFGTGTSQADASTLAGGGLAVIGATLASAYACDVYTANVTVAPADRARVLVFTGGSSSVILPDVFTIGNNFYILVKNGGTGAISILPNGVDRIDDSSSFALAPGESCLVVATGSTWYTIGYGRSTQFQFTKLVKDVSAGGTFTLTSGEAANKLLQFNGNPTTNITVVLPAIVGVYYLQNAYTGAATLTLKTAAGSGVVTGGNDRSILFCDGVNIVAATSTSGGTSGGGGGGGTTSSGTFSADDGTAATPTITFASDNDTGFYHITANTIGISCSGTEAARLSPTLLALASGVKVGIGTQSPATTLEVRGATTINGASAALAGSLPSGTMLQVGSADGTPTRVVVDAYGNTTYPFITLRRALGTAAAPSAMTIGSNIGQLTFRGRTATTWSGDTAWVIGRAAENWTDTANGTLMLFAVTPNGTTASQIRMVLDQNGWLTVGSDSNPTKTLDVVGDAIIQGGFLAASVTASGAGFPLIVANTTAGDQDMIQIRYTNGGGVTHDVGYWCADDTYPFKVFNQAGDTEVLRVMNDGTTESYAFNNISDGRKKKDWADLPTSFLNRMAMVKRGSFTFKDTGKRSVGVEAQSIMEVLPEVVSEGEGGFLSVSYGNAALVLALELLDEVLELKQTVRNIRG